MIVLFVTVECSLWKGLLQKESYFTEHVLDVISAVHAFDLERIISFLTQRSFAVYLIVQEVTQVLNTVVYLSYILDSQLIGLKAIILWLQKI